ncbi:MAG: TetR/AcrR family transcriptional regulator [Burkholderiales bacterium]
MRYAETQKERTRRRLLDRGARHAKKHGFNGSGMDALAGAAGVTTGALYKHFSGKSELLVGIVATELARTAHLFSSLPKGDCEAIGKVLAAYLSDHHVEHPETGCVLPSLTPEVARADRPTRVAFERGVHDVHEALRGHVAGGSDNAWALIALCVGAVMMARALPGEAARTALLQAARQAAGTLLQDGGGAAASRRAATPR